MILVSSCLMGLDTRYDGKANTSELLVRYSGEGKFIPICPEQFGGLSTPREPSEIVQGSGLDVLQGDCRVINKNNMDVTLNFVAGAQQVLRIIRMIPVSAAILKERSPSCGVYEIYDGTFLHSIRKGQGVTSSLLRKQGIPLYNEKELTEELLLDLLKKDAI